MANDAKPLLKRGQFRSEEAFVDLAIHEVPEPVAGSAHRYKYRLAYVVSGACAMRYDNEAGKGDHKHFGTEESPYAFRDLRTLLRDFFADVERMEG